MSNTQTIISRTIQKAIPTFPNDRNMLPREVLMGAAEDLVEQFRQSAKAYYDSNRDERLKPCMSQNKYAEMIYSLLEARHSRPIYHDKNNVYQVLFAASCLMGVTNHRRSWWEETFAKGTEDYLERTNHFQGSKQKIHAVVREIESLLQYELEFSGEDSSQAQTEKLLFAAAEMEQMRQLEGKSKNLRHAVRKRGVHIHLHGNVEKLTIGDIVQTKISFGDEQ